MAEQDETHTGEIRRVTREELLDDLGGAKEVADALGVPVGRVRRWIDRPEVRTPEPVKPLSGMRLYSIRSWREFYRSWRATRRSDDGSTTPDPPA